MQALEHLYEGAGELERDQLPLRKGDGGARHDAGNRDVVLRPERLHTERLDPTDVRVRWPSRLGYTELEYGKSRWVTYSSDTTPVAACPAGLHLVAVIVPSENPEIQAVP